MDVNASREHNLLLEVRPERRDYVNAYRRRFWRALALLVFVGAGLALFPVARAPAFRAELVRGSHAALAVLFGMYAGTWMFLAFMVELLARSFAGYALHKSREALQPYLLRFTPEGIYTRGRLAQWAEISKATENRSCFQLRLRDGRYLVLSHSQIASPADIRNMLRSHLGQRANLRSI